MKKIFSAALALVCVWFATPSFANCNLFDINSVQIVSTGYDYTINNNSFVVTAKSGTSDASRISFYIDAKKFKENTKYYFYSKSDKSFSQARLNIGKATLNSSSNNSAYGTLPSKIDNGYAGVFKITTIAPDQEYVSFFYYLGEQPEGTQITISDIMIIEGDTATAYTPYNPLCATCDGTIVNYTSATGTGVQNGTPTPENPIEPTFYKQGNMVLRKVGDYADSYDATTGKITRRVGVKVFDGTESWYEPNSNQISISKAYLGMVPSGASIVFVTHYPIGGANIGDSIYVGGSYVNFIVGSRYTMEQWKQFLAQQYVAGTPVTIYYPLETETTEDWTETSYCSSPIKIATTKYNETKFSPLNTALANAISVVDSVVSNTITQAGRIATLQAQKQTRPNDIADDNEKCPAGKKCLLVEDASGTPHWYEIVENAWVLPDGYIQLEYVDGTSADIFSNLSIQTNHTLTLETDMSFDNTSGNQLIGVFGGLYFGINNQQFTIGNKEIGLVADTRRHKFVLTGVAGRSTTNISLRIDDATYTVNRNTEIGKIYIMGLDSVGYAVSGKIYRSKIYDNDTLVADFIPVKYGNTIGFYDIVSNNFATQQTGSLTAGPVVE